MGRDRSPAILRELQNLDKDQSTRKSAMKALNRYVKGMDSNEIPQFLAHVSETKDVGTLSGEYTISLYEVLARFHGANVVSMLESIMETIIKTLSSSAGSFPLQQACSKVIPAIARYGIDPAAPEDKKRYVIDSLCRPLLKPLIGTQESLATGAALCLKALVDCENWRLASDEMVNKVCQNAAVALENRASQSISHIGLVMSLAEANPLIVEAYARLLIQSGIEILECNDANSQKRLSAIHMVNFLMKSLDFRSVFSEMDNIVETMEKCQHNLIDFVGAAAYEALQTAKTISAERVSNKNPISPESQTLNSYSGYDSDNECRSVARKLWDFENDAVDISSEDDIFPSKNKKASLYFDELMGFCASPTSEMEVFQIFATPRKLIRSLQDNEEFGSEGSNFSSRSSVKYGGVYSPESHTNSKSVSSKNEPQEKKVRLKRSKTHIKTTKTRKIWLLIAIITCLAACFGLLSFCTDANHHLVPT